MARYIRWRYLTDHLVELHGGVAQRHLSAIVTCCLAEMDEAACLPGTTGM